MGATQSREKDHEATKRCQPIWNITVLCVHDERKNDEKTDVQGDLSIRSAVARFCDHVLLIGVTASEAKAYKDNQGYIGKQREIHRDPTTAFSPQRVLFFYSNFGYSRSSDVRRRESLRGKNTPARRSELFNEAELSLVYATRDNSPLSEWITQIVDITVFSASERILPVFAREAKAL